MYYNSTNKAIQTNASTPQNGNLFFVSLLWYGQIRPSPSAAALLCAFHDGGMFKVGVRSRSARVAILVAMTTGVHAACQGASDKLLIVQPVLLRPYSSSLMLSCIHHSIPGVRLHPKYCPQHGHHSELVFHCKMPARPPRHGHRGHSETSSFRRQ